MIERRESTLNGAINIDCLAKVLGATPSDLPGLWNLPGFPELTTNQLLDVAAQLHQIVGQIRVPSA